MNPVYVQTGGKKSLYFCGYCQRDITLQCRIHCAICENIDVCADCFSSGANFQNHESSHDYQVVDCIEFPVLSRDWTAQEELLLLEGIEKFGFANWKNISDYIGSKNPKQIEDHYYDVYIGFHGYCLPSTFIRNDSVHDTAAFLASDHPDSASPPASMVYDVQPGHTRGEEIARDRYVKEVGRAGRPPGSANGSSSSSSSSTTGPALTSDLPGFLPLREDFDVEHENDAELLLADMEFSPDDHPSERELKLQVVRIYNNKLDERNRRKRFVIDRGIVDVKRQLAVDKRRTKEERELVARMRIFSRFQSADEHEALVEGLLRARRLKQQIEIFQHYRSMGIRSLDQAREYEAERKRREGEVKARRQREASSYIFESLSRGISDASRSKGPRRPRTSLLDEDFEEEEGGYNDAEAAVKTDALSKAPGGDLLVVIELDLCRKLSILPLQYIAIKDVLVREAFRSGTLSQEAVTRVLKVDALAGETIHDFFVKNLHLGSYVAPSSSAAFSQSSVTNVEGEEPIKRGPGRKRKI